MIHFENGWTPSGSNEKTRLPWAEARQAAGASQVEPPANRTPDTWLKHWLYMGVSMAMGVPQNRWFTLENPVKQDDDRG